MSRVVSIAALLDGEHQCELRVRDDSGGGVSFELEDWSGEDRTTTTMLVEPSHAAAFASEIVKSARRARRNAKGES